MPLLYSKLTKICLKALQTRKYDYFRWIDDSKGIFLYATRNKRNKKWTLADVQLEKEAYIYMQGKRVTKEHDSVWKTNFDAALRKSCEIGKYMKRLEFMDTDHQEEGYKVRVYQFENYNASPSTCCNPSTAQQETGYISDPGVASSSSYSSSASPSNSEVEQLELTQQQTVHNATYLPPISPIQSSTQLYFMGNIESPPFSGKVVLAALIPLAIIQPPTPACIFDDKMGQPASPGCVQVSSNVNEFGNAELMDIATEDNFNEEIKTLSGKHMESYTKLANIDTQLPLVMETVGPELGVGSSVVARDFIADDEELFCMNMTNAKRSDDLPSSEFLNFDEEIECPMMDEDQAGFKMSQLAETPVFPGQSSSIEEPPDEMRFPYIEANNGKWSLSEINVELAHLLASLEE